MLNAFNNPLVFDDGKNVVMVWPPGNYRFFAVDASRHAECLPPLGSMRWDESISKVIFLTPAGWSEIPSDFVSAFSVTPEPRQFIVLQPVMLHWAHRSANPGLTVGVV